jgi:hypothetical protein
VGRLELKIQKCRVVGQQEGFAPVAPDYAGIEGIAFPAFEHVLHMPGPSVGEWDFACGKFLGVK